MSTPLPASALVPSTFAASFPRMLATWRIADADGSPPLTPYNNRVREVSVSRPAENCGDRTQDLSETRRRMLLTHRIGRRASRERCMALEVVTPSASRPVTEDGYRITR